MNFLIIEDEPQAVKVIESIMTKHFPTFKCLGCFDKVSTAAHFLKQNQVDFIFLDVQLNGELGIDIHKYLSKEEINFEIVFTTAYSGFAFEAFALCAIDYILKPIKEDRFIESVQRVSKRRTITNDQLELLHELSKSQKIERLILKNNDGHFPLDVKNIIYLKADNVYTEFHLLQLKRIVVSKPIKEYEILVGEADFFRPHRSYIVNLNHLKSIKGNDLLMADNTIIPVSRERKKDLEFAISSR